MKIVLTLTVLVVCMGAVLSMPHHGGDDDDAFIGEWDTLTTNTQGGGGGDKDINHEIKFQPQKHPNWCYAATTAMIAGGEQCAYANKLIKEALDMKGVYPLNIWKEQFSLIPADFKCDCCKMSACKSAEQNACKNQMGRVFLNCDKTDTRMASAAELKQALAHGPVVMGSGGHYTIVYGTSGDKFKIYNPLPVNEGMKETRDWNAIKNMAFSTKCKKM